MLAISTAPTLARDAQRWILVLGSLASFLVGLDALVVTTALPTLHQELGAGIEGLSWTINAYALAFAASILTGSALGNRYGRRRMFVAGLAAFTIASVVCALSPNIALLIASRAMQGIGGGIAVPLALALIMDGTPLEKRGKALGLGVRSPGSPSRPDRSSAEPSWMAWPGSGSSGSTSRSEYSSPA